jgi:hypothetical protein
VVYSFVTLTACYTYRATVLNQPGVTETKGTTVWSFAWGAFSGSPPRIDNCNGQPLSEVAVKENPGYWLVTIVTLGLASPKRVEWRCAPPHPTEGQPGGGSPSPGTRP